jgi:hypothetical protein
MNSLKLFEMVDKMRQDILLSQAQMSAEGREVAFLLDSAEVEAKFTVTNEGKAGIQFYVVTVGGDIKSENVHSIKLKLKPTSEFEKVAGRINRAAPVPPDQNP